MSLKAKAYIAFIICLGSAILLGALLRWQTVDPTLFAVLLVLSIPAACLKVRLPGIRYGTMSVLFIFLLGAIVQLNLPETLAIGVLSVAAQSLWHSRFGARLVQLAFSIATVAIAIYATDAAYHALGSLMTPLRLVVAVSVFFLTNTFPIAVVISLTEAKALGQVWTSCFLWCFPYYLVGAGVVSAFILPRAILQWQTMAVLLPVIYVIYRCYQLYLNRLTVERERAEEQEQHVREMAKLHEKTVRALEAAVTANARLDAVFRSSPLAIITVDRTGRVTSWNRMAESMFGWTAHEIASQLLPMGNGRSEEVINDLIGRTLDGEPVSGVELQQWRKDGSSFEAAIWTSTLPEAEGEVEVLLTIADVSARKGLEEQLRLSQKMEAVGRLAGGIAHDFNNLLTVINGYTSLLLETVSGHEYAVSQAEEVLAAGTRAAELVSQLLTFSRRQMIKPKALEVNQVVRGVQRMLKRVIGEHIDLRAVLHPDAGWIHADLNQMEGVLLNLATNARDAMLNGGVLTIETAAVDVLSKDDSPHPDLAPGEYVRLVIRDTGHGMDIETRQRLFEPFYTTKERGRGTGLGLPSVLGGVEQNAGRIYVWSEPGNGSEFSIYLPRIPQPEPVEASGAAQKARNLAGTETILLVEDEVSVRKILKEGLIKAGYRVWDAANGAEALQLFAADIHAIDLLVTDVVMPVMNGLRLIDEFRRLRPGIRAVCMTGHSDDLIGEQNGAAYNPDLLRKPFLPEMLVLKVRQILDKTSESGSSPACLRAGSQS